MFVIVYDNFVVLGPMRWNKFRFENFLVEEHEITTTLPQTNEVLIVVNENCKIYPIQGTESPSFNPRIERLEGPFWEFTETHAVFSYTVGKLPIDAIKNFMKAEAAIERYKREIAGIKIIIQNTEITVDTNRGSRDVFVQKFLLMSDNDIIQWKFPEAWLTLNKTELCNIVNDINTHIQNQFDWEADKISEIDACETLDQLSVIEILPVIENTKIGL